MNIMKKERNCGIDLLKILLMFMVCVIHVLNQGGILSNIKSNACLNVYNFIYIFFFCCVDCFALISGYMQNLNSKINFEKILKMWLQVVFYTFTINMISDILGFLATKDISSFDVLDIIKSVMPLTNYAYWYYNAYFPLSLIMPIINSFIISVNKEKSKKLLFLISIVYIFVYILNSDILIQIFNNGYSFLWLTFLYIYGVLMKKSEIFDNFKKNVMLVLLALSLILSFYLKENNFKNIINYNSPIIIFNALLLVIIFSKLNINNYHISKVSSLSFGIYLFHVNEIVFIYLIYNRFAFIADFDLIVGLLALLFVSFSICFIAIFIEYMRIKIFKAIKIDDFCNILSERLSSLYLR